MESGNNVDARSHRNVFETLKIPPQQCNGEDPLLASEQCRAFAPPGQRGALFMIPQGMLLGMALGGIPGSIAGGSVALALRAFHGWAYTKLSNRPYFQFLAFDLFKNKRIPLLPIEVAQQRAEAITQLMDPNVAVRVTSNISNPIEYDIRSKTILINHASAGASTLALAYGIAHEIGESRFSERAYLQLPRGGRAAIREIFANVTLVKPFSTFLHKMTRKENRRAAAIPKDTPDMAVRFFEQDQYPVRQWHFGKPYVPIENMWHRDIEMRPPLALAFHSFHQALAKILPEFPELMQIECITGGSIVRESYRQPGDWDIDVVPITKSANGIEDPKNPSIERIRNRMHSLLNESFQEVTKDYYGEAVSIEPLARNHWERGLWYEDNGWAYNQRHLALFDAIVKRNAGTEPRVGISFGMIDIRALMLETRTTPDPLELNLSTHLTELINIHLHAPAVALAPASSPLGLGLLMKGDRLPLLVVYDAEKWDERTQMQTQNSLMRQAGESSVATNDILWIPEARFEQMLQPESVMHDFMKSTYGLSAYIGGDSQMMFRLCDKVRILPPDCANYENIPLIMRECDAAQETNMMLARARVHMLERNLTFDEKDVLRLLHEGTLAADGSAEVTVSDELRQAMENFGVIKVDGKFLTPLWSATPSIALPWKQGTHSASLDLLERVRVDEQDSFNREQTLSGLIRLAVDMKKSKNASDDCTYRMTPKGMFAALLYRRRVLD